MKKHKIKLKKITADKRKKNRKILKRKEKKRKEKKRKEKKRKEKKRKEKERKEKKRKEKKRKEKKRNEKKRKESQNKSKKERNLKKKASKRKKKRVLKHLGKTGLKPVKTFSLRIFLGSMVQATLVTRHGPVTSGLQTQSLCQALVCIIAQGVLLLHAPRIKSCFGSIPCLLFLKMCLLLCSVLGPRRRGPWFLTS